MDPISALSLASAIVQFLDFALQALALCREIRDDATGAMESNKRIEQHAKHIKSLQQDIRHGSSGGGQGSRRIVKIANDCTATSNEILQLLDKVRLAKNASIAATAKATFRVLKEKRTIEKLQNILKERQALLDSALTQDVRNRLDLATLTNSQQFELLQDGVKDLAIKLERQSIAASQQFGKQTRELEKSFQQSHESTQLQLTLLRSDLGQQRIEARLAKSRTLLLNSLFYAEHAARQSTINPPHQKTFDWVFDESRRLNWSNLPEWLQGPCPIYWINGKAGSGKSTLMAHIVSNPRTSTLLRAWTDATCTTGTLHLLTFFFWRLGSPIQRSVEGLLRSLLFQLLDQVPEVIPLLLAKHRFEPGRIPSWTERMLTDAMHIALESATRTDCFCFFIDGLDEFEGDAKSMLDFITTVSTISQVKICVSSRRDIQFVNHLSAFPQLRMEQLNYDDIRDFVTSQLQIHLRASDLAWPIYSRADGVFLWAVLVTRSTVQGIEAEDDDRTLKLRIELVPREVVDLIKQIFVSLDEVYTESLGILFNLMRPHHNGLDRLPNLALLTAARMDSDLITYEDFLEQCVRMKKQVVAQSCGLLQVADMPTCEIVNAWASALRLRRGQGDNLANIGRRAQISDRTHGPVDAVTEALIRCELTDISWLHRSVYDIVYGKDADNTWASSPVLTLAEATELLIDGKMRLLVAAPSIDQYSTFTLSDRISDIVIFTRKARQWISNSVSGILDDVIDTASMFSREEFASIESHWTASTGEEFELLSGDVATKSLVHGFVYSKCIEVGLTEYPRLCIDRIKDLDDCGWILSRMIHQCCTQFFDYHNLKSLSEHADEVDIERVTAEERNLLLHDLLEALVAKLSEHEVAAQAPGSRCAGFWRADGKYWVNLSWDGRAEQSQRQIERETVCALALSYYRWTASGFNTFKYDCWDGQQKPQRHPEPLTISTLKQWRQILAHWNVHIGFGGRKLKYIDTDTFYCEGSASARLLATLPCQPCDSTNPTCFHSDPPDKPCYRILCKLEKSSLLFDSNHISTTASLGSVIMFDLSPALDPFFAFMSSLSRSRDEDFEVEKWLEESGFFNAMMKDVWEDEKRQLNAWQQLFVLACIRKERRENLNRI